MFTRISNKQEWKIQQKREKERCELVQCKIENIFSQSAFSFSVCVPKQRYKLLKPVFILAE